MGAVRTKAVGDLRRRRLQSAVIGVVLFLAAAAATLALSILVESHAPFEHAFDAANGAHLVLQLDGRLDPARVADTAKAAPVTASTGPWPVTSGAFGDPKGGIVMGGELSGRPDPGTTVDRMALLSGRWWQAPDEVVLGDSTARRLEKSVGSQVTLYPAPSGTKAAPAPADQAPTAVRTLTIVGIAGSVSTPDVGGWMSPDVIRAIAGTNTPDLEMLYRVQPAATAADLGAATAAITAGLPAAAVHGSHSYLEVRRSVDRLADLYVPVLLAFAVFALLAAAFMIANVVGGVVLTSYRDIGVMKAIGFTPRQVTAVLLGQILLPASIGTIAGVLVGTAASQPVVMDTAASFGLPTAYTLSASVVAAVLGVALATAILAALLPSIRAGSLSAVAAMTRGASPSDRAGAGRLRRLGLRLPVALPGRLGASAGLAHPGRAAMTLGALVVGVAAATFAIGLNASLVRAVNDLNRAQASPIRVEAGDGGGPAFATPGPTAPGPTATPDVTAAIAAQPGTARSVAIGRADAGLPGVGVVPFVGYDGDTSWLGYAVIRGRWFAGPGEAVAPSHVFASSGLHVGDSVTLSHAGRTVTVRLVGEIFDTAQENDDNLVLRGTWQDLAALAPGTPATRWEIQPASSVDLRQYRTTLQQALGAGADVYLEGDSESDASFVLFLTVVGLMGLVLIAISLGGVFNTVLLETRQRTRELAVLKAVGMTPAQVIAMIVATVVPAGIVAGVVGVPLGLVAQRLVLDYMGQVAAKTAIPAELYDVFGPLALLGLALLGLAIGAAGAFLPAQRAARARIAPVLQAE